MELGKEILEILHTEYPLTTNKIAVKTKRSYSTVRNKLEELYSEGAVIKKKYFGLSYWYENDTLEKRNK